MNRSFLISICLFTVFLTKAQNPFVLVDFGVECYQNQILINWVIAGGNQCAGVKVEHSTDSINFVAIYDYPGICGNVSTNEEYSFLHKDAIPNTKNYYRLNLGTNGFSDIICIKYIKLEAIGYSLFPMPLEQTSKLYFNNDDHQSFTLLVYNISGARVIKLEGLKDNEINMGQLNIPIGTYYFKLYVGNNPGIGGKFIVTSK